MAELKAILEIERTRSEELERRVRDQRGSGGSEVTIRELADEIRRLQRENTELAQDRGGGSPTGKSRVTKTYLKFIR